MQILKKQQIKKKRLRMAACMVCAVGLSFSASANNTDSGPTTNVWIDVVQLSSEARLSVTVPFSYGFAVLGTTETDPTIADEAISYVNGNLYLPNVRVEVSTSSTWGSTYQLTYTGTIVPLENYSTDVREENMDQDDPEREGLPVELRPYIVDSGKTGHYWKISSTQPLGIAEDFKKYRMVLDEKAFSVESQRRNSEGTLIPVVEISETIALPAPPDVPTHGHTAAGTARIPSQTYVPVNVQIGGKRGQYHQVEESVNVANIYWEIIPGDLPELP